MNNKTKNDSSLKNFNFKFKCMIFFIDLITVILVYFIMPLIQNFPPFSEEFGFQNAVQTLTHIQQYTVIFIIGFSIHLFTFKLLMKNIFKYLVKYFNNDSISYNEIKQVRKDCINIPYKVVLVQMILIITIGILFNFIMLASELAILKFTLVIIAVASLISIILLIGTQQFLYNVIITTYNISNKFEKNIGYRIPNSHNLLFQMVPFITFILIVISLIGYSKAVQQEGFATGNYYKAYIESKNIDKEQVNMESLKNVLSTIPLLKNDHYYFIISPNDKDIYTSNPNGIISGFVIQYKNYFYDKTNGFLYEKFGVDEQLYTMNLKDVNNDTWYIGFKYPVVDFNLLVYYLGIILIVLISFSVLLYVWSHNISNNLIKTTAGLKNILEKGGVSENKILPIVSNDEFGDLAYYFNKIQELTIKNINEIQDNQETLMEQERLASLGQLIGGIAHNLKTPIMSISGAAEGLTDLVKEYDSSIDDPEVNSNDHHEIANDMNKWISKIKTHTEYMSDIITAVKGQAVALSNEQDISFTVGELLKRVNILMKHELKSAIIYLNIYMQTDENTVIRGDVNSLVQVINNMVSNSIQAYNGKTDQNIDIIVGRKSNDLLISIKDYGCGLSEKVKNKLFKEMITTKGKNGTGLGLYMSYSTIRAHFNGNITVESEKNKGTTFTIILPL